MGSDALDLSAWNGVSSNAPDDDLVAQVETCGPCSVGPQVALPALTKFGGPKYCPAFKARGKEHAQRHRRPPSQVFASATFFFTSNNAAGGLVSFFLTKNLIKMRLWVTNVPF
jgi:hypothetical protein